MNSNKIHEGMGYIDDDLIAGAIEYKRTKKTNRWIKWGALAACLCAVIMIGIFASLDSGNTFTLKAYAMDVIEDGTVSFVETDLITQSNNWGGYFDGEYFYLNVGLGYDGKNIESVELVIENGFFAAQSKTEHSQEQNVPKVYIGADNQLVMYGTNFTPVGNSIVLDTPASADNLIFIAIPANNETDIPKDINITATATFLDGSKKVIETSLDFTGIGVFVWNTDLPAPTNEIVGKQKYTGYFLRTETNCFFIAELETETFYKNEPIKISPPTWDKETTVNFDSFKNGDRIEVEILQIGDTEPRDMPVYSVVLVEEGTIDNISNGVIEYLQRLGYTIVEKQ